MTDLQWFAIFAAVAIGSFLLGYMDGGGA